MENVEIKEEVKEEVKPAKKVAKKSAKKELNDKQKFMIQCNEKRLKAGIRQAAYTEEEISKAK